MVNGEVNVNDEVKVNDDINQQATFTPFLVDSNDLATGSNDNEKSFLFYSDTQNGSVPILQNLYETYYPREAKAMLLTIERVITVTWLLATGPSGSLEVSIVLVLRL